MICQKVDLFGRAWEFEAGGPSPTVYGLVQRDLADVVGLVVGVTARNMSAFTNTWSVAADPDCIEEDREPGEPVYDGLRDSMLRRIAQQYGTARPWMLVYSDAN